MKALKTYGIPVVLYLLLLILTGNYGYWWMNLVIAYCVSYLLIPRPSVAFYLHFVLMFTVWTGLSIIKDQQTGGEVSLFLSKLAGNIPPFLTYMLTGLTGGLLTGWAAFLGSYLKKITTKTQS